MNDKIYNAYWAHFLQFTKVSKKSMIGGDNYVHFNNSSYKRVK